MKQLKVIISGGGTGGHIFPAIAIANEIKRMLGLFLLHRLMHLLYASLNINRPNSIIANERKGTGNCLIDCLISEGNCGRKLPN